MRLGAKKESALERRLKQVKKDLELVSSDVKAMNKAVREADGVWVRPKLRSEQVPPPEETPAPMTPPAPESSLARPVSKLSSNELFPEFSPGSRVKAPTGTALGSASVQGPDELARGGRGRLQKNKRFANYFVGASLDGIQPLRQERTVQRNKAIFMIVLVLFILAGIFYLVF
jgi:hypothetical protein